MNRLVQIVPRFYPAIDGVGDFARELGSQLKHRFGVESAYVSGDPNQPKHSRATILNDRTSAALCETLQRLEPSHILVHYSGYGYDERGLPDWLVRGLEAYQKIGSAPVTVFFHEIWSSGPFWKSAFYLGGAQKRLVLRLLLVADASFTSTPKMQRLLTGSGARTTVLPIPSAVPPNYVRREISSGIRLAIFGLEPTRARALTAHANLIEALHRARSLESLVLIGKDARVQEIKNVRIAERTTARPNATAAEIVDTLSKADALLSFYPANLVTKSSSIMSAFACGCPVILPSGEGNDQFAPRPPLLVCDGSKRGVQALLEGREGGIWRENSRTAFEWYEANASWDVAAVEIGMRLESQKRSEYAVALA